MTWNLTWKSWNLEENQHYLNQYFIFYSSADFRSKLILLIINNHILKKNHGFIFK